MGRGGAREQPDGHDQGDGRPVHPAERVGILGHGATSPGRSMFRAGWSGPRSWGHEGRGPGHADPAGSICTGGAASLRGRMFMRVIFADDIPESKPDGPDSQRPRLYGSRGPVRSASANQSRIDSANPGRTSPPSSVSSSRSSVERSKAV